MFGNVKDFYPTPRSLANKLVDKIDFRKVSSCLEPSAGKGDLIEVIVSKFKYSRSSYYSRDAVWDIDAVEINTELQHILKGKGHRVIHDNFLSLETWKHYDAIIANFPFSEGEHHLLKSLKMQENGGILSCLVNAETIKNPYTNVRKEIMNKLEQHNADIEFIQNAFTTAENPTGVEVALIYVDIPKPEQSSIILEDLRQQESFREESQYNSNTVINADFLKGIVEQYNFEVKAGLKLIAEYNSIKPLILSSFKDEKYNNPVLELKLRDRDDSCSLENGYIKQIRMKYWKTLFTSEQFMGLFTSNLRQEYYNKVNELKDYDFSLYNIYTIKIQMNNEMVKSVEKTILNLFEEFSHKHHWQDETSKNVHYYNGWKTNQAWKINKKVIIPLSAWDWGRFSPTQWRITEKLEDIQKVFNYLSDGSEEEIDLKEALKFAEGYGDTKKIKTKYFYITFYKKGTCHIEFTNEELLHKFNLFGSQRKGWIPPSYGKKKYKDMTPEEKRVIDEFEGELSYSKVMSRPDYYIVETSKLLMLA